MQLLTGFVQNAALLLILALIFDLRSRGPTWTRDRRAEFALGLLVGGAGVLTMLVPVTPMPGVILDSRGLLLAISGLFFGPIVTVVAMLMTIAYRVFVIAGPGSPFGVAFIIGCATFGLGWRALREGKVYELHWTEFATAGLLVGGYQLFIVRALVGPGQTELLWRLTPTLLLVSAGATAVMGLLIEDRAQRALTVAAIGEREASLRTLTEQLPAIVYRAAVDDVSTTVYISPAIQSLGYSVAEWSADPSLWLSRMHIGDRDRVLAQLADDRASNRASALRYRFQHRDGRWRHIHDVAQLVHSPSGAPLYLQGVMFDVTEQEEALARSRLQLQALDAAADAIGILDVEGRFLWVNRAFTALTYYQPHEALGRNPRELLKSGRQDEDFYESMWDDLLAGKTWAGELINKRKDGSEYTEEQTITPVRDGAGTITHFVAIKRDITVRKGLELQLSQSQRIEAIGRLAGGVAHDFNNLLTVINGTLEMSLPQVPAESELREELLAIRRAADRGAKLTRQLLAFSRQQVLQPAVINMNGVVNEVVSLLSRVIGEHISIKRELASDLEAIRADAGQLEQVLMNLSMNARDAMPNGGTLTISTRNVTLESESSRHVTIEPGEYVELCVADTGIGMDAATRERIFEPFFTTKPASKGTGLGLPTAYGIVRQSGGRIWVYSEPGRGSVFKLYFPAVYEDIVERPSGPSRVYAEEPDAGGNERILVVEDEDAIRRVAVKVLASKGYQVLAADSGEAAVALLEREPQHVDLLLTDMVMPGMSGPELADALRSRAPDLKVLFTSGYSRDAVALQFGMTEGHFIEKPYGLGALTRAVRGVLDQTA